jgi:hypothetical protein
MQQWTGQLARTHRELADTVRSNSWRAGAVRTDDLPEADAALHFPLDRIAALGDGRADALAREIFELILYLLDRHWTLHLAGSRRPIPRGLPVLPLLDSRRDMLAWLETHCPRPFNTAPAGSWVTRWPIEGGYRYCLIPSRAGTSFAGVFATPRMRIDISQTDGMLVLRDVHQ